MDFSYEQLKENGYTVIPNFLSSIECDKLLISIRNIIETTDLEEHRCVFSCDFDKPLHNNDYFMRSGDKVRFFFEENVFSEDGKLKRAPHLSLNKMGHALHELVPEFKHITFSDRVKDVAKKLNFVRPSIVQSMLIFKQPEIGGQVSCHQDATFLQTDPVPGKLYGLWIALEDATEENGCLRFIPGSHKNGTIDNNRLWVRKPNAETKHEDLLEFTAPIIDHPDSEFVSVPVAKGSMILIDGLVVHKSFKNTSKHSRNVYTFHLYESNQVKWLESNWLQPTTKMPFSILYDDSN